MAAGSGVDYYRRVDSNDPSTAQLVVIALKTSGLQADLLLKQHDTVSAILAASNDEATNSGYARVTYNDSALSTPAPDDTNHRFNVDISDPAWTAVAASGGAWSKLIVAYSPTDATTGGDATNIPITAHDFVVTPNGQNITAVVNAAGFLRAASA